MNLEIDAVVSVSSEALSATYNQCIARMVDFILLYLCNNEFAVGGSAGFYFRHFQGLPQGHIQMFQNQRM